VAHAMEDVVRALRDHRLDLTPGTVDSLFDGVKMLEQILASHRAGVDPPEIEGLLARIEALLPSVAATRFLDQGAREEEMLLESAPALSVEPEPEDVAVQAPIGEKEAQLWRFIFIPSAALARQGYSVDWVRQQLLQMGTLEQAMPLATEESSLSSWCGRLRHLRPLPP